MIKYSIIVPCYNEEDCIEELLNKFDKALNNNNKLKISNNFELIFVNNGSNDSSQIILEKIIKNFNYIKLLNIKKNLGYGFGIYEGLKFSKGEYIGWTHADLQAEPNDVFKAIEIIESSNQKYIFVKGFRKNRNLYDSFFTFGMSFFESILFGTRLENINSQPNIFSRSLLVRIKKPPKDFSFDLFVLLIAKYSNYKIFRFNVDFNKRLYGYSKSQRNLRQKINFIITTIKYSIKLKISLIKEKKSLSNDNN